MNERIEDISARVGEEAGFICECADMGCTHRLSVPVAVYERVRSDGRRFVVAQGHERPQFERVIDQGAGWLVVEKTGQAGELAAHRDPRES